jgi:predicted CopG family antitoxin
MAMIRVKEEVRRALKGKKLFKKESYNDILCRLMNKKIKGSRGSAIMGGLKVVPDSKLIQRGLQ